MKDPRLPRVTANCQWDPLQPSTKALPSRSGHVHARMATELLQMALTKHPQAATPLVQAFHLPVSLETLNHFLGETTLNHVVKPLVTKVADNRNISSKSSLDPKMASNKSQRTTQDLLPKPKRNSNHQLNSHPKQHPSNLLNKRSTTTPCLPPKKIHPPKKRPIF